MASAAIAQAFSPPGASTPGVVRRLADCFNRESIKEDIARRYNRVMFPKNWEMVKLPDGDTGVIAHADNPVLVVGFTTGFKAPVWANERVINFFNAMDISVLGRGLKFPTIGEEQSPKHMLRFFRRSLQGMDHFYFNDQSPLYTAFDRRLPRIALTHSTSGLLLNALLMRDAHGLDGKINHIYNVNPFFDKANASRLFEPRMHKAFMVHAALNFHTPTDETLLGGLYSAAFNPTDDPVRSYLYTPSPNFGEVLTLYSYGNSYMDDLERRPVSARPKIPQTFILSKADPFSSYKCGAFVADLLGADIVYCDAKADLKRTPTAIRRDARHWPLHELPEALEWFAQTVVANAQPQPAPAAA